MFEGDVEILLTIEVRRIAAHAAFQPVVLLVIAGQTGKGVVILRTRCRHTGCDHCVFVGFQRLLRFPRLRFKTRAIAQYHRAFHRRWLRFCLWDQPVKRLLRRRGIAKLCLHQRHTPLRVQRRVIGGGQFRQLAARCRFVACSNIHFRQAKNGVDVIRLARQDILIRSAGGGVITPLLRPVGQREVNARGRWLLAQHRFRFGLFAAFPQTVSGFQHLIALQPINQLLNIAVPLRARQAVDMRQRRPLLIVTGEIQPVSVNLLRIVWFLLCQIAHQGIGLATLPGLPEILRQPVSNPYTAGIQRQPLPLKRCRLRPFALIFQCLRLLCQTIVLQAAFDVINAAPLAGRERGNKRFSFFR